MDMLRASAMAACALGLIFSVISNACPSEKYSKQLNVIFSLIFILVIIKPFMKGDFDGSDLSFRNDTTVDYSDKYDILANEQISANICSELEKILITEGITCTKISVNINNLNEDSISITNASAELDSENYAHAKQVREIISDALGIEASSVNVTLGNGG
ncbi:MAG: hypothetical protein ACI4KF_07430 [Huintestinicola sp.]